MNTNDMTPQVFQLGNIMAADNFAGHHSVSVPVINKFVFLPGCHSMDSPFAFDFRRKTHSET